MKTCYAICEADVEFDDVLKEKIKHELRQLIHKDNVSVIINGFRDYADILNSIINGIDFFTGEIREANLHSWEIYKFDILIAIESCDRQNPFIQASMRALKKTIRIWI